jgi:hypothetical protein
MAYVVRAAGSELNEDQVIQFVAGQVCHRSSVRHISWLVALREASIFILNFLLKFGEKLKKSTTINSL